MSNIEELISDLYTFPWPHVDLREEVVAKLREVAELRETHHTTDEEALLLHAVLDQARETLLVSIKGTPEDLGRSLGKLNLACLAHWNWRGAKIASTKGKPSSAP